MTNPLLPAYQKLAELQAGLNITDEPIPVVVDNSIDESIEQMWNDAYLARTADDRRLARVILKSMDRMLDPVAVRSQSDETEIAAQFTKSAIEARIIGLAFYWPNDLEQVAFTALGLVEPDYEGNWEARDTARKKWWQDVVVPAMNAED